MLVADAVTQIKRQFIDEYDVVITTEDVYAYILEAETDIIRRAGSNDVSVDSTVGAFPLSIPEHITVKRLSIDGRALKTTSLEELDGLGASDTVAAEPQFWYTVNKIIHLWPQMVPSTTVIKISYNKMPILMTGLPSANTFTVPSNFHSDVINFALAKAFSKSGETKRMQEYMEMYDRNVGIRASEAQAPDTVLYKGQDPEDFNEYDEVY